MPGRLAERYRQHHAENRNDGEFIFVPERLPLFVAAVGGPGKRVLDLGCRTGAVTEHFLPGNEVVGVDVDEGALEQAAARGITTVWADIEELLPFEAGSFDVVVAGEILEHVRFSDQVVAEIARVLKPGGVLVGSVPNAYRLKNRLFFLAGQAAGERPDALADVLAGCDPAAARADRRGIARLHRRSFHAPPPPPVRQRSRLCREPGVRRETTGHQQ